MLKRKFSMPTNLFSMPKGSSPFDTENIKLVKRVMKSATGADSVDVSFNHNANDEPITDLYNIELDYPSVLADGKYVTTANLDKNQGKLVADLINALAGGGDAKGAAQKVLDSVNSGGSSEEGSDSSPLDSKPTSEEGSSGLPSNKPTSLPSTPGSSPVNSSPKMPFASKSPSRTAKAMFLESKFGIGLRDAIDIVKEVDSANDYNSFLKSAKRSILDENNRSLSDSEYRQIALAARGEHPDFLRRSR